MEYIYFIDLCNSNSGMRIFNILGNLYNIIKIAVPIIIIVMGSIDLVKAMSSNDESRNVAIKLFGKRILFSVLIFFVFPIVTFLFNLINQKADSKCMDCFLNPNNKVVCNITNKNIDIVDVKSKNECDSMGAPYMWQDNQCVIDISKDRIE